MKKLLLILFMILFIAVLLFCATADSTAEPRAEANPPIITQTSSENLAIVTTTLLGAIQQALALLAYLVLHIMELGWEAIPPGLKYILGLIILIDRLVTLIGIFAIKSISGIWRRHIE